MIEIGTLLQDRYLIEKKIGAGGMGAVYLAIDKRFDNFVAIKETLHKDKVLGEAFEREARLLNALQHSVLPHVSDYFAENDIYFLVMQYIEGEDLSDMLKREGAFPVPDVLHWMDSLLDALDYLHSQEPPIIHRDIKPHNLKLTPRGGIMLLDFGLAKLNYQDTVGEISVFGYSRTYSPLEQIQGTGTNARSDIFALGATAYHLLTGKAPINSVNRAAAIVNGLPDPLQLASELKPEIPIAVAKIINTALALNPENRFGSAKEMRLALENAVSEDSNNKVIEKGPEPVASVVSGAQIIGLTKNNNFPALEAFAAEAVKQSSGTENQVSAGIIPNLPDSDKREIHPSTAASPYSPMVIDISKKLPAARKNNQKMVWGAIMAAVLILGAAAVAFYLNGRRNPSEPINQAPVSEIIPAANSNHGASKPAMPERVAETKTKPAVTEKTAEKAEVDKSENTPETEEDLRTSTDTPTAPVPAVPTQRKKKNANKRDVSSDDVDETESVDDSEIEQNPTEREDRRNRNREERQRRWRERTIPDEMTEEEFKQIQRESKQRRRDRRNQPLPY